MRLMINVEVGQNLSLLKIKFYYGLIVINVGTGQTVILWITSYLFFTV